MNGKVALVTGGTAGVGLSLVRALVRDGTFVHFVGRNVASAQAIEDELNTGPEPVCRFVELDLSSLREVDAFTKRFSEQVPKLDLLANVAGVMLRTREETEEGNERTFAINHLAAFLLSVRLRALLARAESPRILNVSGAPAHLLKPCLDFDNLQLTSGYSLIRAAINAVHAKTVITEILAERFAGDGIDVNAFHPGAVKSDLARNMGFALRQFFGLARLFMASESKSGVHLATSETVTGTTGSLFVGTRARTLAFDNGYKDRLWSETERLVEQSLAK